MANDTLKEIATQGQAAVLAILEQVKSLPENVLPEGLGLVKVQLQVGATASSPEASATFEVRDIAAAASMTPAGAAAGSPALGDQVDEGLYVIYEWDTVKTPSFGGWGKSIGQVWVTSDPGTGLKTEFYALWPGFVRPASANTGISWKFQYQPGVAFASAAKFKAANPPTSQFIQCPCYSF